MSSLLIVPFRVGFCLNKEKHYLSQRFHFIVNRTGIGFSKKQYSTKDFQNSPSFERLVYFYVTTTGNFKPFEYCNFKTNFLKKRKSFSTNWSTVFHMKILRLKMQGFQTKLPCKKPVLRQLEWEVQNGPITKN